MYIISRCLIGCDCRYDGGNNRNQEVIDFCQGHNCYYACPEMAGNLPCPRPPAEYVGDRILDKNGKDVTESFVLGAKTEVERALEKAAELGEKIQGAILKAKSPSCGRGQIYDGTFSGKIVPGNGCFAQMLIDKGVDVITEKEKIKW